MKIAIIGGGCSGLMLASMLDPNFDIYVFEKNNKLGKKILASGNGKCNFTNISSLNGKYNLSFANKIIDKFSVSETIEYFKKIGLIYKSDDQGRCYPISECSSSVLDCLKSTLKHVRILLDVDVKSIENKGNKYIVKYNDKQDIFDYVICCSGSKASNLGSEKAYSYLSNLNLKMVEIKPSLVPIKVKEKISDLKGVRVKCHVSLEKNNEIIYQEDGEVLFKEDALSGIAVFNASSHMNREKGKYKIKLDLSNGMSYNEMSEYFKNKDKNLFIGYLNDKLGEYIVNKLNLPNTKLNECDIKRLIKELKELTFEVTEVYSHKEAQVCAGGVSIDNVTDTLELKKYKNLFMAGELLDIDGVSGGYNMQFAWSSAAVIAKEINKRENKNL